MKNIRISATAALAAIVTITVAAIAGIVVLEITHNDYTAIVGLTAGPLAVLIGLIRVDSAQAERTDLLKANQEEIKATVKDVRDQTNGALNTALAIVQANTAEDIHNPRPQPTITADDVLPNVPHKPEGDVNSYGT